MTLLWHRLWGDHGSTLAEQLLIQMAHHVYLHSYGIGQWMRMQLCHAPESPGSSL